MNKTLTMQECEEFIDNQNKINKLILEMNDYHISIHKQHKERIAMLEKEVKQLKEKL